MLLTTIVSFALLGYYSTCSGQAASSPDDNQCYSWWDSCLGQNFCGNLSVFQEYNQTGQFALSCIEPIPLGLAPSPGECVFVPDPLSSESAGCQFVNPCAATLTSCSDTQYQCTAVNESGVDPPQCVGAKSPPPPTQPCAPGNNGSCEFFQGYCSSWPGHCNSGYQCGTTVDLFKFITGPQPDCSVPSGAVPPVQPGECIYQLGECIWSGKLTQFLREIVRKRKDTSAITIADKSIRIFLLTYTRI